LRFAEDGLRRTLDRFRSSLHIIRRDTPDDLIATFDVRVGTPEDLIATLGADTVLRHLADLEPADLVFDRVEPNG